MNYRIKLAGLNYDIYNKIMRLLILTATSSDYNITITSDERTCPASPFVSISTLQGSLKNDFIDITLDFDGIVADVARELYISPYNMQVVRKNDAQHYWGVFGALFKVITDLSPAYVTGYLLEHKMKDELELFNKISSQLPFEIQVAVNEMMVDFR